MNVRRHSQPRLAAERSTSGADRRPDQWANTYTAYEDLPESEKEALATLRVVHDQQVMQRLAHADITEEAVAEIRATRPPKSHPLVWTHRSGRKSLVLGFTVSHIEGMDPNDSRALLDRLQAWSSSPSTCITTSGVWAIWSSGTTRGPCTGSSPTPWTAAG